MLQPFEVQRCIVGISLQSPDQGPFAFLLNKWCNSIFEVSFGLIMPDSIKVCLLGFFFLRDYKFSF